MKENNNKSLHRYLLLLVFIILTIVSFNGFMGEDEGRFSYMGRVWVENDLPPYVGSVENKTPGIFILNALSYLLFGTNIFFLRFIGIISLVLTSHLIYKITKYLCDYEAGLISMTIFGLTMSWRSMDGAFSSYTESFMILFIVLSFLFIFKINISKNKRFFIFIAGISMGLAIAFKQIAITSTAAVIVYIIISYKERSLLYIINSILLLCFGIILSSLISIIPLWLSNVTIIDYINGAWLLLLDGGSYPSMLKRFIFARELWIESRMVYFYPFLILLTFQTSLLKKKYFWGLIFWLIFDFAGVNASGYYFGHQIKQLIPSLSIIIGILLANQIHLLTIENKLNSNYLKRSLIILIIFLLPYNLLIDNLLNLYRNNVDTNKEIGLYIKSNTEVDDYIFFMTNANAILAYTDRVSSSKYFNPLFVNSDEEFEEIYLDIVSTTPKYIIKRKFELQFSFPEQFETFVNQNYVLYEQKFGFLIYKRDS